MSATTAGLILAWIALLLLALAAAGLLRRIERLEAAAPTMAAAPSHSRGLMLPGRLYNHDERTRLSTALVFVAPTCGHCQAALDRLPELDGRFVVKVASEAPDLAPLKLPSMTAIEPLLSAHELFESVGVPGTPYLLILNSDGVIIRGDFLSPTLDLSDLGRTTLAATVRKES